MNEWVKTIVSSGAVAALVAGLVGWFAASYKIDKELHSRQGEAAYEALIKANTLYWQSRDLRKEAEEGKDQAVKARALDLKRESDASYVIARHKIAAYGDERVVKAMSDYYSKYFEAAKPCENKDKFRSDAHIYKAIRHTLGVGGVVSDEELANVVFLCSLR